MTNEHEITVPHHAMDWFTNNPTYITLENGISGSVIWSTESGPDAIRIFWDATRGVALADGISVSARTQTEMQTLASLAGHSHLAIGAHRSLAQRELHHPMKFGLVRKPLPQINHNDPDNVWIGALGRDIAPEREIADGMGWFAPDADPEDFGTLFIYSGEQTGDPENSSVVWRLGQIGQPRRALATAKWDDATETEAIYRQVLDDNSDYYLTIATLDDSDGRLRELRKKQNKRKAILLAREAFARPKDRIRPRLVEDAEHRAFALMGETWADELKSVHGYARETLNETLDAYEVFDYNKRPKPANIAREIRFVPFAKSSYWWRRQNAAPSAALSADHFDEYAKLLAAELAPRALGTVLRTVDTDVTVFYVVRNTELFLAHRAVVGVPESATISQYDPATSTWITPAT